MEIKGLIQEGWVLPWEQLQQEMLAPNRELPGVRRSSSSPVLYPPACAEISDVLESLK